MNLNEQKSEFEKELVSILNFWTEKAYDFERKTFFGRISNTNQAFPEEPLSAVLITRILWAFSSAQRHFPDEKFKTMASEAYRVLIENFWDNENGGIFWSVSPDGKPVDTKKQFYAQAFFIYALSEYFLAFQDETARQLAISMFLILERYGIEFEHGGYIEACTADWSKIENQRLSAKDMNVRKSMNTHLHILEAYTNLYSIWKNDSVKQKLESLVYIFLEEIYDHRTGHFKLFFDDDWTRRGNTISYGHDIEGSWLLINAARALEDKILVQKVIPMALKLVETTVAEGQRDNGGIVYEREKGELKVEYHWWPQAEAVIGFFNAWQVSGDEKYVDLAIKSWNFIQKYIIDQKNGEWFWGVDQNFSLLPKDKINEWKAPYHNGRMCLEMIRRMGNY